MLPETFSVVPVVFYVSTLFAVTNNVFPLESLSPNERNDGLRDVPRRKTEKERPDRNVVGGRGDSEVRGEYTTTKRPRVEVDTVQMSLRRQTLGPLSTVRLGKVYCVV